MVMDCLRNAKRFHATVSFIADTGLKDATDNGEFSFILCICGTDFFFWGGQFINTISS